MVCSNEGRTYPTICSLNEGKQYLLYITGLDFAFILILKKIYRVNQQRCTRQVQPTVEHEVLGPMQGEPGHPLPAQGQLRAPGGQPDSRLRSQGIPRTNNHVAVSLHRGKDNVLAQ